MAQVLVGGDERSSTASLELRFVTLSRSMFLQNEGRLHGRTSTISRVSFSQMRTSIRCSLPVYGCDSLHVLPPVLIAKSTPLSNQAPAGLGDPIFKGIGEPMVNEGTGVLLSKTSRG